MSDRKNIFIVIVGKDKSKSSVERGIRGFLADTLARHDDIGWEKDDLKEEFEDYLEKISFEEQEQHNVWIFEWETEEKLGSYLINKKKNIFLKSGAFFFLEDYTDFEVPEDIWKKRVSHNFSNTGSSNYNTNSNYNSNQTKKKTPYDPLYHQKIELTQLRMDLLQFKDQKIPENIEQIQENNKNMKTQVQKKQEDLENLESQIKKLQEQFNLINSFINSSN